MFPQAFARVFNTTPDDLDMHMIYDVSHNVAKIEEHVCIPYYFYNIIMCTDPEVRRSNTEESILYLKRRIYNVVYYFSELVSRKFTASV